MSSDTKTVEQKDMYEGACFTFAYLTKRAVRFNAKNEESARVSKAFYLMKEVWEGFGSPKQIVVEVRPVVGS
jgi:hypothetical protein